MVPDNSLAELLPPRSSDIFTNPIFRSIVVSLMATYGCWIFARLACLAISVGVERILTSLLHHQSYLPGSLAPSHIFRPIPSLSANVHQRHQYLRFLQYS